MKIREHRRGFAESMETVVEIEPTIEAVAGVIRKVWGESIGKCMIVTVTPYYGFDQRNGWDTHIVVVAGHGVFGFTDGPLSQPPSA